jgi:hypothetical protein
MHSTQIIWIESPLIKYKAKVELPLIGLDSCMCISERTFTSMYVWMLININ